MKIVATNGAAARGALSPVSKPAENKAFNTRITSMMVNRF